MYLPYVYFVIFMVSEYVLAMMLLLYKK